MKREAEQVKSNIGSEQRILLAQRYGMPREQVIRPVGSSPLAQDVADQKDARPDEPAEKRAKPIKNRELDNLTVNTEALPASNGMRKQKIQTDHKHESHAGKTAERDLCFEDRPINDTEALLAEPKPIDEQVGAT